jgi:ammonium transporter Rh
MGSASSLRLSAGGALAVGIFAGVMSTMGFARLMPALESKIGLGDTCGVHNLHGMPGGVRSALWLYNFRPCLWRLNR